MRQRESAPVTDVWLTPQQVGRRLGGVTAQKIRAEIMAGELPAVYLRFRSSKRGIFKIREADADAYVDRMLAPAMAATTPARITGPTLVTQTTRSKPDERE